MHLKKFIKIQQLVHKILSKKKISTSGAITLLKMNEKYCSIIQIYILSISMHIQNLIEIHKLIHKVLSIYNILTSIKGHNSVKIWPTITCIRYNMDLIYINASTKFYQNSSICSEDIKEKHFLSLNLLDSSYQIISKRLGGNPKHLFILGFVKHVTWMSPRMYSISFVYVMHILI